MVSYPLELEAPGTAKVVVEVPGTAKVVVEVEPGKASVFLISVLFRLEIPLTLTIDSFSL